jgi:hypothetical protein
MEMERQPAQGRRQAGSVQAPPPVRKPLEWRPEEVGPQEMQQALLSGQPVGCAPCREQAKPPGRPAGLELPA